MTRREETVEFIQKEAKRLRVEEHIDDLIKKGSLDKLPAVECRISNKIQSFITTNCLELRDEEIEKGDCAAVAIWLRCCVNLGNQYILKDTDKFAYRLADEAGDFGKSVAALMLGGYDICDMSMDEFFSCKYAEEYNGHYGIGIIE